MQRYQYINNLYFSLLGDFLSGGFCTGGFCPGAYVLDLFLNGKCWELPKVSENSSKKIYAGQRKQKLWQITVTLHVYICTVVRDSDPQETRVVMPLTRFNNVTFLCLFQVRSWIFNVMSWSFCVQLKWEVIVRFVDIGEIDDHHCLNFLFRIAERTNVKNP